MKDPSRVRSALGGLRLPPRWILVLCLFCDAGTAGWRAVSTGAASEPSFILISLIWPGLGVFVAVYVFAWLGWALDID